jgi:ectoine hydroxylase-related dioxygenase (phytanoyl-CoA dioxygenase family)
MMALDDFTVDNGATYFMPCSQNSAETPSDAEFMTRAERVFPRAGDAVFFNARTFHMGAANSSKKPRHALTMNVCRSYMRQLFDYPRMVPQDVVDALGDVGRRFLGFNVRMPTTLEEYYATRAKQTQKP